MRKELNAYLIKNNKLLNNKIRFLHNDLWSFDSKDLDFVVDLKNCENAIWGISYGIYQQGLLPIVYGVSFFEIGRLEQLRKFFGYKKAKMLIFNAGVYGYDKYGWEHSFKNNDDIEIMKSIDFKIYNSDELSLAKIFDIYLNTNKNLYIRLGKDKGNL